jgi:hypothetical protein
MTHPPQDGEEHRPDDGTGSSRVDPDRFPTEPAPAVPPASGPTPPYVSGPGYGANPPYGSSPYGQNPHYGTGPQVQPYGSKTYGVPPYGGQQYGPPQYGPPQYGPPQYGPPQYGAPGQQFGPPPGPPQKSKVGLIAVLTGVALVVIAAVVVMVMTLQSTVLDAASAERDVAAQFEQREGVAVDLDCPDDMEVRTGATYECNGKTADGESVTLRLAITDEKTAAYTWTEP